MLFGCPYKERQGRPTGWQPVDHRKLDTVLCPPYRKPCKEVGGTGKIPNAGTNQIQQYVGIQHPVIKHVYLIANKSCCVNTPIKHTKLSVKFNADMSANTMIMASSQSTLAGRSASAKPFSGQAIKPTRAVALPRSRAYVVKAVAKVHYWRIVEQISPCARSIAQHTWKRSMLALSSPSTPCCFSLYCLSFWKLKV